MNKVEKKRQREQHVVEEMIQLYCRKNHSKEERRQKDVPCLSGTFRLRKA